jgi:NAD+ kinase
VRLNGVPVTEELIADGLVACTPFGSSAYFRSITRTVIRTGIGLAYNNCTDLLNHLVISEEEEVEVLLHRGPALLVADNDPTTCELEHPDRVLIRRSSERFRVLAVDTLRCAECRYVHAPRRRF